MTFVSIAVGHLGPYSHILIQVMIYRRLLIGRDGNLDQFIVTCTRKRALLRQTERKQTQYTYNL